jgi:hypothetical protein
MNDPLQALLVDETAIAREELAQALRPYLQLGRDGGLWLLAPFDHLSGQAKVLCVLLAVKAQHLLGLRQGEAIQPQELVELSSMPPGTVRPKLSQLAKDRLVSKSANGYTVPDGMARRAVAELGEQGS